MAGIISPNRRTQFSETPLESPMATVYRENRKTPTRQYIATAAFNTYFKTYTLTTDPNTFVQTGSFADVTSTASLTPRGRILRETGERLFPGQPGVNTLMVKVFDPYSFLSGYIDPNAEVFAVYNTDKPAWADDGYENNASSGTRHQGPSVLTLGDVISAGGQVRSSTLTAIATTAPATLDASLGQVFSYTPTQSATLNATGVTGVVGSLVYLVVTTSGTTSYTITFGTGFKTTSSTLATGTVTAKVFTITFISDGTNLNEVARTTAM